MKKWFFLLMGICFLLIGCGKEQTYEPVEIDPEIDVCEVCNMGIAHEHYATEIIGKDGEVYKFDDLVCLFEFMDKDKIVKEEDIAKKYVRDHHTGEWMDMEMAYFVYHPDIWTPMASGVISFKTKEEANSYIEKEGHGELYDYEKLLNHSWEWYK